MQATCKKSKDHIGGGGEANHNELRENLEPALQIEKHFISGSRQSPNAAVVEEENTQHILTYTFKEN